jgi:hypothetical protein
MNTFGGAKHTQITPMIIVESYKILKENTFLFQLGASFKKWNKSKIKTKSYASYL